MDIFFEFINYLKNMANVRSEKKIKRYGGFAAIFLDEYLARVYPESRANPANLTGEQVEEFIQGWYPVSDYIIAPEDVLEAGLALRHFFRYLEKSGRINERKKELLIKATRFENFEQVFYPEESDKTDLPIGVTDEEFGEIDDLIDELTEFLIKLESQVDKEEEIPSFIMFLIEFNKLILEKNDGIIPLDGMDMFFSKLLEDAVEKSKHEILVEIEDFKEALLWYYNDYANAFAYEMQPENSLQINSEFGFDPEEMWYSNLSDFGDIISEGFLTEQDFELQEKILSSYAELVGQLRKFPANMWVMVRENKLLSGQGAFEKTADRLIGALSSSQKDFYEFYFVMLSYWGGLLKFRKREGIIKEVLKTRLGHWFFNEISKFLVRGELD